MSENGDPVVVIELAALPKSGGEHTEKPAVSLQPTVPLRCWLILLISCVGVLMASISTSALIIAFPVLLVDLNMTLATMMWILLVLLLVIGAVVGIAGKLGDIFGQANLYKFGYITFVLGSLGGGFSHKSNQGMDMLACRVIIGFGGAFLFTNSSAILTDAFAPYNKVGLSQGIFQLTSAMGMVLGPLLGGAFAETNWRWIFFWNVPLGLPLAILAMFVVQNHKEVVVRTFSEHLKRFDWIGAIFYPMGMILLLTAMIQGISPTPALTKPGPFGAIIAGGCFSALVFITSQFYVQDPLIPPSMFLKNKVFSVTTIAGTCMSFARNSIIYTMIFYLQGPHGMNPLQAGIALVPFGIGVMVGGFVSGGFADKIGVRKMCVAGPLVCLAAVAGFTTFDKHTRLSTFGGVIFVAGLGIGMFASPNNMANMLSVQPNQRGVAAAVGMLTMMFTSMIAIVLTFSFVLHSMSQEELFVLFIYGGSSLTDSAVESCLQALYQDFYLVIIACVLSVVCSIFNDFVPLHLRPITESAGPVSDALKKLEDGEELEGAITPTIAGSAPCSDHDDAVNSYAQIAVDASAADIEAAGVDLAEPDECYGEPAPRTPQKVIHCNIFSLEWLLFQNVSTVDESSKIVID